ncbi:uncharacterized protein LOC144241839 [Crocuta crocuta]
MAALRSRQPNCIRAAFASTRAAFRKRQRNMPHRFKINHKKNHMDLIEGLWREVLDPCDGESWEDPLGRSVYSFGTCCPGDVTCAVPSHALNPESLEVHVEDPLSSGAPDLREAASGVPASPEAEDVDMPPAEPGGGRPRLSGAPEDWRMAEEWPTAAGPPVPATEPAEPGRHTPGRTPGSRPPPRLRSEKDRGPKLTVSKRKLELLLAEPEKSKRKRRCAAQTQQGMN